MNELRLFAEWAIAQGEDTTPEDYLNVLNFNNEVVSDTATDYGRIIVRQINLGNFDHGAGRGWLIAYVSTDYSKVHQVDWLYEADLPVRIFPS